MRKVCDSVIKYSILGLVLLIPLFFLPWTMEAFEFSKQYLLFFLVSLSLIAWLVRMIVVEKRIIFIRTSLDIWILIFMLVMILSAVFSMDKISSWFGFYGKFSDSIIGLLTLGVLYFIVTNNLSLDKKESSLKKVNITGILLISSWIALISAYLSVFGIWQKLSFLPNIMSFRTFNPTGSSLEALSIFLVFIISLSVGLILKRFLQGKTKKRKNIIPLTSCFLLILFSLLLLILVDFSPAWWVLLITMFLLLTMALWTRLFREKVNILIIPIIILIIAATGLLGIPQKIRQATDLSVIKDQLPQELILDHEMNFTIVYQSLKENSVLGSGPATYFHNFVKFKPASFNQDTFWNIRFDKGPSHILDLIATTGILGILSYLALISIFLLIGFVLFSRKRLSALYNRSSLSDKRHPVVIIPLITAWFSLFIAQFVYWQNTVLAFFFWLFTALVIVTWQRVQNKPFKKISFSFERLPEVGLIMNVVLLILIFLAISGFYLSSRYYLADVRFVQAMYGESNQEILENMEKAAVLNKRRDDYRNSLSQVYLSLAWIEARKSQEEQDLNLLQAYVGGAIQQARVSTSLNPNSVAAWENLAAIYRDSQGLVNGSLPFAIESFTRASELEPTNPFFFRERCRLNLISEEEEKNWDEIMGYCQKAVDLKSNYLDAHIQLALAYEKKGEIQEAINRMEGVLEQLKGISFERGSNLASAASEIYFQLGRLYFNLNNNSKAVNMFEQSVVIVPEYANSRYALAMAYQRQGRNSEALQQYKIVDQLVPNNENVRQAIEELEGE